MGYVGVLPVPGFAVKSSALVLRGLSPGTGSAITEIRFCQTLTCPGGTLVVDAGSCIRMALLAPVVHQQALQAGQASPGAFLLALAHNTVTLLDTFSDASLVTPNPNPLIADANGMWPVMYLSPGKNYDFLAQVPGPAGPLLWFQPNIEVGGACDVVVTDDTIQMEAFL